MTAVRVRCPVDDAALDALHDLAFGSSGTAGRWAERLERHALTWAAAYDGDDLAGFAWACWDGGTHPLLLDTAVHPAHRRSGVGRAVVGAVVDEARRSECRWLHIDYEPRLAAFYEASCGFRPTAAGLLDLAAAR